MILDWHLRCEFSPGPKVEKRNHCLDEVTQLIRTKDYTFQKFEREKKRKKEKEKEKEKEKRERKRREKKKERFAEFCGIMQAALV